MTHDIAPGRHVWNIGDAKWEPFGRYDRPIPKLFWAPLTFDRESGEGCFFLRFEPGGVSRPHAHYGYEEFLILDGELMDHDGGVYKKGDFVCLDPGTSHYSTSPNGCLIMSFYRRPKESDTAQNNLKITELDLSWGKAVVPWPDA